MEHRIRSKLNAQIYQEACEWFIECRAGDLADAARVEFDRWLRKSPEHLSAYLEVAAIWNEGPSLDPARKYDLDGLIVEATHDRGNIVALSPFASSADEHQPSPVAAVSSMATAIPPAAAHRFRRWLSAAIAAGIAAAAIATGTLIWSQAFPGTSYATAMGEQRSIELADGSMIALNSLSKARVHYTQRERDVVLLKGQALFTVAKDAARPFIVTSGATRVRAVGTEFDVYRKRDDTVVTVVEGRVAVIAHTPSFLRPMVSATAPTLRKLTGASASIRLATPPTLPFPEAEAGKEGNLFVSAGEQLTVTPKGVALTQHADVASATAWTQRELIFESASLSEVAEEFNRYNEQQLVITDPSLETFHISGIFSSTDPSSLIRFLRERPGLRVAETGNEIRIEKK